MQLRSFLYGLSASLVLTGAVAMAQNPALDNLVVASVNGEEITRRQLVARLIEFHGEEALEKMIRRTVVSQGAKTAGVAVTPADVEAKLKEIKGQFKSEEDYRNVLARSGLTEKQHRDEVYFTLLLEKVALKAAPVTDQDLQRFDIRMLVAPDKPTAEKWIQDLNGGADFAQLAGERSVDPALRQAKGRMKPFMTIEMLDVARQIEEQQLKPGAYTKKPFLLTGGTWGIVKLEGILPISQVSAAERDRMEALLVRYRMDTWLAQAVEKAKIERPVALNTILGDTK